MASKRVLRALKPYDAEFEKNTYDASYYENHTKYYEKGIPFFEAFVRDNFEFESIADCGCGTGAFTAPFQKDKKVFGFDYSVGSKQVSFLDPGNYYEADLTEVGATDVAKNVDVVVSLEVYEHIKPAYEETYLSNVFGLGAHHVIISCAPEGQWGRHHYNCKNPEDVIAIVTRLYPEYEPDNDLTEKFKKIKKLASFYRKNTIVFRKKDV